MVPGRSAMQAMARAMNLERTPSDQEYQGIRGTDLHQFLRAFKPKVSARVKAGTMPATFQVFNVHRMLSEDASLRHQVGFSLSVGMPSKAMMIPTVWVVTQAGVPIETTYLDLDDTAILITTKDRSLEQLLENWFQTSRHSTSSQIKNVAMICSHPHHISVEKFIENRENLLINMSIDRPMRTVKVSYAGHVATMSIPLEQTADITQRSDLHAEMDETIEGVL